MSVKLDLLVTQTLEHDGAKINFGTSESNVLPVEGDEGLISVLKVNSELDFDIIELELLSGDGEQQQV